ncbi:MAG: hypothetical protein R3181_09010 [Rubricoccaceae bacterium]|nr:hypothetical protein [Rubricoccaceae bacterium]
MSTHRFTEEEVHAIFEQAAQRQEAARRAEDASRAGLTLEELQRIGAEAGIDPAHVAAAALAHVRGERPPAPVERETLLGMPTRLRRTRVLAVPLTDALWAQALPVLRDTFGGDGDSSLEGPARTWRLRPARSTHDRPVQVTFTPEGGGTRVEVEEVLRASAHGFLWGSVSFIAVAALLGALLVFGEADPDAPFMIGLFTAMALLFGAGSQIGLRLYGRRQEARYEAVLDRLEQIARTPPREGKPVAPEALPEAAPRLDLEGLPDAPKPAPARRAERWRDRG